MSEPSRAQKIADVLRPVLAENEAFVVRQQQGNVHVTQDAANSYAVALVPVADEKLILDTLKQFNLEAKKGDDGVYTVALPNASISVYFRFSDRYAYVDTDPYFNAQPDANVQNCPNTEASSDSGASPVGAAACLRLVGARPTAADTARGVISRASAFIND